MAHGSGFGPFRPGERITLISQLSVGDLLTEHTDRFGGCDNLVRVLELPPQRFYGIFVDPTDTSQLRRPDDKLFCHWDFELERDVLSRAIQSLCVCAHNADRTVTTTLCPLHADTDPCLTMARVTGQRRRGTIRRGVCSSCGHRGRQPEPNRRTND